MRRETAFGYFEPVETRNTFMNRLKISNKSGRKENTYHHSSEFSKKILISPSERLGIISILNFLVQPFRAHK